MKSLLDQYLNEVFRNTVFSRKEQRRLMEQIRPELEEQLEGQEIDSYEALVGLLGEPEQLAESLSETDSYTKRVRHVRNLWQRSRIAIAVLSVALLASVTFGLGYYFGHEHFWDEYEETASTICEEESLGAETVAE